MLDNCKIYSSMYLDSTKVKCDRIVDLMTKSRIANYKLVFLNSNQTFCASSLSFHWFNSTEKVTLSQVKIISQVKCVFN